MDVVFVIKMLCLFHLWTEVLIKIISLSNQDNFIIKHSGPGLRSMANGISSL